MWKSIAAALMSASLLSPVLAAPAPNDEFEQGMATMWEALWHQAGTATRLVRWEQDIKLRIHGVNLAAHKQRTLQAMRDAAAEAGLKVIDVSDEADAETQANVTIEITPDDQLSKNQPCETRIDFRTETTIDSASMQMRDGDAARCAYHEAMHVLGVRGHPEGRTVLSYFGGHGDGLLPLDKAMLRAWYSPQVRAGMTPFEVLPVLTGELARIQKAPRQALKARDRFLARTLEQMQAFANGSGDVPLIVKRCGKATDGGIRFGRMEMSYFLGVAYLHGATVRRDASLAERWMQRAALLGSRSAQARLAPPASAPDKG
jgi:hypothetical protein